MTSSPVMVVLGPVVPPAAVHCRDAVPAVENSHSYPVAVATAVTDALIDMPPAGVVSVGAPGAAGGEMPATVTSLENTQGPL